MRRETDIESGNKGGNNVKQYSKEGNKGNRRENGVDTEGKKVLAQRREGE